MRSVFRVLVATTLVAGCAGTTPATTPAATPEATAPAATAPAATAAGPRFVPVGAIAAGTYVWNESFGVTVDVPAGWEGCCDQAPAFAVAKDDFTGLAFEDLTGLTVYGDSCNWKTGTNLTPVGAQAFAAAFAAQIGHQGTEPDAITVSGIAGWHVQLTVPADQQVAVDSHQDFEGCDEGQFRSWGDANGGRFHQGPSQVDDLYLVDVDGHTVVFDMISSPDITPTNQAALDAMLASVRIE